MTFRDKLLGTLRVLRPVLDVAGVLVVGSEVPNLLEPDAASTLVVSQDVDIAIPIDRVAAVKDRVRKLEGVVPSPEEPSVLIPVAPQLIEINLLGLDSRTRDASETYVFEDPELPLMVFGTLGLLRPGPTVEIGDLRVRLPRIADMIVEKLLTDRSGEKGARDLLIVAGLLDRAAPADVDDLMALAGELSADSRHAITSALTVLSLMEGRPGMPDPARVRHQVTELLRRIEGYRG